MTTATLSPSAHGRTMPSRWIRWVAEASATDMPMPWSRVRPPRGGGVRPVRM